MKNYYLEQMKSALKLIAEIGAEKALVTAEYINQIK